MSPAERLQSLFVAVAALVGLAAGVLLPIEAFVGHLVLPALLVMLAAVFVQMNAAEVGAVRRAKTLVAISLVVNFVVVPALAWALGQGLLGGQPDVRIGLLLLLVTPCTDWYLVFTAIARGHTGIAAALLPVNLILQLLLLPVYVLLLGGQAAMVDVGTLAESVLLVLVVPLVIALLLRWTSARFKGIDWRTRHVVRPAGNLVLPLLYVAVFAMFAWQARTVLDHGSALLTLLPPLLIFFTVVPLLSTLAAKLFRLPAAERVTLVMTTTARNSPIALAIAVAAFPDRPLIAVALVVGPLLELPVLALLSQLIRVRTTAPESERAVPSQ
ncbi:ACR3 family arsenite efflux pump ArsB [Stackebrandtia endophytica]|uniref:ACR3 family arsenite efflux pump ArsB n=1 Tax=Stackebrandtia endophytica TaxID=1496996 RepID=A0A543B3J7_9ACTN|nr:bile acid:sodium symporter [Stackebrandtia endophytica]TQL79363.1 ACR3 family arsenite efflux pump ArsB [Stackebrandtia endophytica]